jgi:lipopolysaccharide transport system ATP-binding protein
MLSEIAVSLHEISKVYYIYEKPVDRLKQALWRGRRRFYTEFWALRDVSFDVPKGSTVGIIGRNGSGKSTLLQIIAGILTPIAGTVAVSGRVAALLELGAGFNPEFTGRENVFLNGAVLNIGQEEMEERFEKVNAFADIGEFIDRPVKTYSAGMYLRLAFAIVTQVEADILLIDEILAVGDEKFQRKCYNRLEEFQQQGGTVLFVSHDTTTVERICDHAFLIEGGSLVEGGKPKVVIDSYHNLLYDAENQHLSALNEPRYPLRMAEQQERMADQSNQGVTNLGSQEQTSPSFSNRKKLLSKRAVIENIRMTKSAYDAEAYLFKAGEQATIWYDIVFSAEFPEVTAGIRIKTIQGVEVYGTSTSYHAPVENAKVGDRFRLGFKLRLDLCPGAYSVNCAIAEPLGRHDMKYLDKRSDILLFKVLAQGRRATGIADLKAEIGISREV